MQVCKKKFKKCRSLATKRIIKGTKLNKRNSHCVKKFKSCKKINKK